MAGVNYAACPTVCEGNRGMQVEELQARLAIQESMARYCRAMDRMDNDQAVALWHEGGTVNYEPGLFTGLASDFVSWVHDVHEQVDLTVHRVSHIQIEVNGDRAVSEAYGHVMLMTQVPAGTRLRTSFGRYVDRWSRRSNGWAIDHREYRRDVSYTELLGEPHTLGTRTADPFALAMVEWLESGS